MLEARARRGRPKGTGIDDSDRIARLAELIRTNPNLKPTTAIKKMGIADPSAVRRLRDKYKAFQHASPPIADTGLTAPPHRTRPAAEPGLIPAQRN